MGLFFKKVTKQVLDRRDILVSRLIVGVCFLLIVANVAVFVFVPRLVASLALVVSNAITLLLAALAFKPANTLIEKALEDRQAELDNRRRKEKELEEQVGALQTRNRELENRLDTRAQAESMASDINFTFKLEQMEYAKKGYVVKEEDLESFLADDRYHDMIPDVSLFEKMLSAMRLKENSIRKILYIKKYYYKVAIGIDFSRIKFAFDGDSLLFAGVKFALLHDITSELEHDSDDIDHCWIVDAAGDRLEDRSEILTSPDYLPFKEAYKAMQDEETRTALEEEVETLCRQYTEVFRRNIASRFPQAGFVDRIDDTDLTWYALKDGGRYRMVRDIASNMLLLTNVINETKVIEEQVGL